MIDFLRFAGVAAKRGHRVERRAVQLDDLVHRESRVCHDVGEVRAARAAIDDRELDHASFERQRRSRVPCGPQTSRKSAEVPRRAHEGEHQVAHAGHRLAHFGPRLSLARERPDALLRGKAHLARRL